MELKAIKTLKSEHLSMEIALLNLNKRQKTSSTKKADKKQTLNFSIKAAKITEPEVKTSTWALGNQ
jgi:hypothetical protein